MIIIGKKKLIGAAVFSFLLILATAIWGYKVGMQSALKSDSELVLFFGFIGAGLEFCLLIAMLVYAKRKENDFLMVTKAIQLNGILSDSRAKKFKNCRFKRTDRRASAANRPAAAGCKPYRRYS